MRAVEWLRGVLGPAGTVVADTKICDAGAGIARDAFAADADVVRAHAALSAKRALMRDLRELLFPSS
jgi:3-keto-L-gulonate-6-phosphate decarboxylase